MNRLSLLLVIVLACHLGGMAVIAQEDGKSSAQTQGKVGMVTRSFTDEKRQNWQRTAPRPLRTAIWYAAAAKATREETIFGGTPEEEIFAP